jgi:methyl-accepting chemotaxis protein
MRRLSVAAKLYLTFLILVVLVAVGSLLAIERSSEYARLNDEFESAFRASRYVEQVNGLIYGVVMESRGVYMSSDIPTAKRYGVGLLKLNDEIGGVVEKWSRFVRADDANQFAGFKQRIRQFQEFRRELVRRGVEINPAAGREYGDNDANRTVRTALNKDLEELATIYARRSNQIYRTMTLVAAQSSWILIGLISATIFVAIAGMVTIRRAVARPLSEITQVTESVAAGRSDVDIPYLSRKDEIGALARSIAVFKNAMQRNHELGQSMLAESEDRARREREDAELRLAREAEQARAIAEHATETDRLIEAFRHAVEEILDGFSTETMALSDTAGALQGIAGDVKTQATTATSASDQTSANVHSVSTAARSLPNRSPKSPAKWRIPPVWCRTPVPIPPRRRIRSKTSTRLRSASAPSSA